MDAELSSVVDGTPAGWSIDSRTLESGDVFFAVAGPNHDGHDYVEAAFEMGATAAVVQREFSGAEGRPLFRVDDPAAALGRAANAARRSWDGRVVAVTGSNGKTTVKEATAALLGASMKVSKTAGNLNNELGLPLTLLRIGEESRAAVVEMGMNHSGEIRKLARIAEPDIGVVTNVSAAHVGHFASVDEIAAAKRELVEELGEQGVAVLNADDERVRDFARVCRGRVKTFSTDCEADVRAEQIESRGFEGSRFRIGDSNFQTKLVGRHNVCNLCAAVAVAEAFGIEGADLIEPLAALVPVGMRGVIRRVGGAIVIDDCYNSNPAAAMAMLALLAESSAERRIAVLGEMRELGERSPELHRAVGQRVAELGIDRLVAVGADARFLAEGAIEAGMEAAAVDRFDDAAAAGEALREMLRPGDAALFKASRGVGLESALGRVLATEEPVVG